MCTENKTPKLCLKTNTCNALFNGERITLDSAPVVENEKIMIPASALALLNIKADKKSVDFDAIEGIYKWKSSMGVILFSDDDSILGLSDEKDLKYILTLANSFVFEIPQLELNKSYAPATEKEREDYQALGEHIYSILKKRNNTHPYILADQSVFDKLRSIYLSADGSDEHLGICQLLEKADDYITRFPALNEDGSGLASEFPTSGYGDTEYDAGGRHTESEFRLNLLRYLAFAYNVTKEEKYSKVAYFSALEITKRLHWGPGHFLNCSGAAGYLSMTYDWLYNSWKEFNLDTCAIERGIYTQGIHHGFNSAIFDCCDFPSEKQGTGWRFKLKPDNWNSVCNSGLIISSLCLLGDQTEGLSKEEIAKTKELLGACLASTTHDGLVYTQYAPDGSYVESNSYWAYGTNNLFRTMGSLYTALGTDLGMHNGCGIDKTCYYAINSESNEFVGWNYHDGHMSKQDTSTFNILATISADHMLYALRKSHIKRGKEVALEDMLFHPTVLNKELPELKSMPLDYAMTGIDAFVVRSGWSSGSMYAGLMGGENPAGGSHNQIDSGSFVYHNLGKLWITDLGCDNYNLKPYNGQGYFSNYGLYRRGAEGNNTLCLKSLPYGQLLGTRGIMSEYHSSDSASYCIIDNKEVYGDKVSKAERGMLLTNDRKTLVISDSITFNAPETAFWIAHYESKNITAEVLAGGKKCVLTHKDGQKIYLTLTSETGTFEIMSCYDFLLDGTVNVEGEHSRDDYSRLVVKFENVNAINSSVIIEAEENSEYTKNITMEMWKTL